MASHVRWSQFWNIHNYTYILTHNLNFWNGIIHHLFLELIFRDIKMRTWSWSAKSIEPDQIAWPPLYHHPLPGTPYAANIYPAPSIYHANSTQPTSSRTLLPSPFNQQDIHCSFKTITIKYVQKSHSSISQTSSYINPVRYFIGLFLLFPFMIICNMLQHYGIMHYAPLRMNDMYMGENKNIVSANL